MCHTVALKATPSITVLYKGMPRLSARKYLQARKRLRRYWDFQQMAYGYLSPDEQVLEHRTEITKQRPSLPHQAGRALAKIDDRSASGGHQGQTVISQTKSTHLCPH